MRFFQAMALVAAGMAASWMAGSTATAQIVINELVVDERTAGSGNAIDDVREFIELYNAGETEVNLADWSIVANDLALGIPTISIPIPSGTIAPGGYFVIGGGGVPGADYVPQASNIFPDNTAHVLELRNSASQLIDAVGYDVFRTGLTNATAEQIAQIGNGFQGQLISMNAIAPNVPQSWGRWRDGRDSDNNGRDFGVMQLTPGSSNDPLLPLNPSHTIPDVDGLAIGTVLPDNYHASFVLPRVIDPTVATPGLNPRALPERSPQGGNAIVAWDNTGGGNTAYSKELVNRFDLYAYFDTTPLGVAIDTNDEEWESSIYGIGSSDAFFGNPDPTGGIFVPGTVTQNASTGIGWMYQQYENALIPELGFSRLVLLDFGDGGNSLPEAEEWTVITTIDMSEHESGWFRLGIDYDPETGNVTARFGDETFPFTTETDLLGTFFVGHREGITAEQTRFDKLNPPIYDLVVDEPGCIAGDFNCNGAVENADLTLLLNNWGAEVPPTPEGWTGIPPTAPAIDNDELTALLNNWGNVAGSASAGGAAVPEPASLALVALGMLGVAVYSRRQREKRRR